MRCYWITSRKIDSDKQTCLTLEAGIHESKSIEYPLQRTRYSASDPLVQYFIYLIDGVSRDSNRSRILLIELAIYRHFIQIFHLVDVSRCPTNHFCDAEYLGAEILFGPFRKLHLLFADTHVLTRKKSPSYRMDATSPIIYLLRYRDDIGIRYFGRCHARCREYCVIGVDEFRENVDISVRVFRGELFIEPVPNCSLIPFQDREFNVGIFTYLNLNAFRNVLILSVLCRSHPHGTTTSRLWIFRVPKDGLKCLRYGRAGLGL